MWKRGFGMRQSLDYAARGAGTGRRLDILLWCVQIFLALVFVNTAVAKLMGSPEMVALFTAVGSGQWLPYVTGVLELTGAVLIVIPKTRRIGAALIATVMLGAPTAQLFILGAPSTTPAVLLLLAGVVVWGRRYPGTRVRRSATRLGPQTPGPGRASVYCTG